MLARRLILALLVCILPVLFGAADVVIADGAAFTPVTAARHSFENGDTHGWAPRGAGARIASVSEAAHAGAYSLITTNRTANWHGASLDVKDLLKKGAACNFTGYVRLVNAPGAPSTVKFTMEQKPAGAATNQGLHPALRRPRPRQPTHRAGRECLCQRQHGLPDSPTGTAG